MTSIHLIRRTKDGKAVRGCLRFEGQEIATLENADYIIPVGIYAIRVTWSPRFKRMLPLVMQVPGRSGIRFHRGTKPEHSKGCILVSAVNEQELTAKWLALQASNEPIKIIIKNEDWKRRKRLGESSVRSHPQDPHAGFLPCGETQKKIKMWEKWTKILHMFAYVGFFLYLCANFAQEMNNYHALSTHI